MANTYIHQLTLDQQSLILPYREKWRGIALSVGPIDRQRAIESVAFAYSILKKKEPQFVFFNSVYEALNNINFKKVGKPLSKSFWNNIWNSQKLQVEYQLDSRLDSQLKKQLVKPLDQHLGQQLVNPLVSHLISQFEKALIPQLLNWVQPELWACEASFLEFTFQVLNCHYDPQKWLAFKGIVENCGWIFPCEKTAIICDRPIVLTFDINYQLHGEGKPAIQFVDGYSLYAYHGVKLPEKYGTVPPHQWQPHWILEEQNPEMRQVLIQGTTYTNSRQSK